MGDHEDRIADVLAFWFGAKDSEEFGKFRREWFHSTPEFDADIHAKFGELVDVALKGGLKSWEATPEGAAAKIILLDQFTRNTLRGTPGAFEGDAEACRICLAALDSGQFETLPTTIRWFAMLPLMHSEDIRVQTRGRDVEWPKLPGYADNKLLYAEVDSHCTTVERFGRFPHRNAILGRESTPEEVAFLATLTHTYGQSKK